MKIKTLNKDLRSVEQNEGKKLQNTVRALMDGIDKEKIMCLERTNKDFGAGIKVLKWPLVVFARKPNGDGKFHYLKTRWKERSLLRQKVWPALTGNKVNSRFSSDFFPIIFLPSSGFCPRIRPEPINYKPMIFFTTCFVSLTSIKI